MLRKVLYLDRISTFEKTYKRGSNVLVETFQILVKVWDCACIRVGKNSWNNNQDFVESLRECRSASLKGVYLLT